MYTRVSVFLWLLYCNTVTPSAVKLSIVDKPTRILQERTITKVQLLAKGSAEKEPFRKKELDNVARIRLIPTRTSEKAKTETLREEERESTARIYLIPQENVEKTKIEPQRKEAPDKIAKVHPFVKRNSRGKTQSEPLQERVMGNVHLNRKITVDLQDERSYAKVSLISRESGRNVEGFGGVRQFQEKIEGVPNEKIEFKPLPFPVDFRFYDVNQDGKITLHELVEITGAAENEHQAFAATDTNGDGLVTLEEYRARPWGYNPGDVVLQD